MNVGKYVRNKLANMKRHELYNFIQEQGKNPKVKYPKCKKSDLHKQASNIIKGKVKKVFVQITKKDADKKKEMNEKEAKRASEALKNIDKELGKVRNFKVNDINRKMKIMEENIHKMRRQLAPYLPKPIDHEDFNYNIDSNNKKKHVIITAKVKLLQRYGNSKNATFTSWYTYTFLYKFSDINIKGTQNINEELVKTLIKYYILDSNDARDVYENPVEDVLDIIFKSIDVQRSANLNNVIMQGMPAKYKFLEKLQKFAPEENKSVDYLCTVKYILNVLQGEECFKTYDMLRLKKELKQLNINYETGMTVYEILRWIKYFHPKFISMYAIDPLRYKVFNQYVAEKAKVVLCFIVNNKHCYGIYNKTIKNQVSKSKRLDVSLVDNKFSYTSTNYKFIERLRYKDDADNETKQFVKNAMFPYEESKKSMYRDDYVKLIKGELKNNNIYVVQNILQCAEDVIVAIENKYQITVMKWEGKTGQLNAFVHPISEAIIEQGEVYELRVNMCEVLYNQMPSYNFMFKNQSFKTIAQDFFNIKYGKIQLESYYSDYDLKITDEFQPTALIRTLVDGHKYNKKIDKAIDIRSCYPNAVLNNDEDYPVFTLFDNFVNFDGTLMKGEYLVDTFKIKKLFNIPFDKMIMSYPLVKYLLDNDYMTNNHILLQRKARLSVNKDVLKDFIKDIFTTFPRGEYMEGDLDGGKFLANCFIGGLNKKYVCSNKSCITSDPEVVSAYFMENTRNKNTKFNCTYFDNLFTIFETEEKRSDKDHGPIYRQIICQAMIDLLELIKKTTDDKSQLIGYNTDCIFVRNPVNIDNLDDEKYKIESWKPKLYKQFKPQNKKHDAPVICEWTVHNDICFNGNKTLINGIEVTKSMRDDYINILKNKSFCCCGCPGCQKTTLLKELYVKDETLVLCYTNKACQNILKSLGEGNHKVFTFDSEFYKSEDNATILKTIKRIQIDEFSMVPMKWMNKLYQIKKDNPGVILQFFGDPNQCKPVEEINIFIDYMNKNVFKYLCNYNLIIKGYVKNCARYEKKLYQILDYFKETKHIPDVLNYKKVKSNVLLSICKTNIEREKENDRIINVIKKENKNIVWYHDKYHVGQKVISNINLKSLGLYNSRFYYISSFNAGLVSLSDTINGEPLKNKDGSVFFMKVFKKSKKGIKNNIDPAYCITVYRYQGDTIEQEYNILESEKMTFNEMYTALSRGRSLDKVHWNYVKKIFKIETENKRTVRIHQIHPSKGEIYELSNNVENKFYVGCTENDTEHRFLEHKNQKEDSPIHKHGHLEDWKTKKISNLYYFKKEDLLKLEKVFILKYKAEGKEIINTQGIGKLIEVKAIRPNIAQDVLKKYKIIKHVDFFRLQYNDENGKKQQIRKTFNNKISKCEALNKLYDMLTKIPESVKQFIDMTPPDSNKDCTCNKMTEMMRIDGKIYCKECHCKYKFTIDD